MYFPPKFPKLLELSIKKYYEYSSEKNHLIIKTKNIYNVESSTNISLFVNLEKTNNFRHVNKFHEKVNLILTQDGIYCSCAETSKQRSERKWKKSRFLGPIILFIDFLYKRVIPKVPITREKLLCLLTIE